jgi:nicotinate-nucleotide adenylyltransferase
LHNILLFGGSFDPIHNGHLHVACALQRQFKFHRFIFLPCRAQVLKNKAPIKGLHRLAMLILALREHSDLFEFEVDDRELTRLSPSFMVTTLKDYRLELGPDVAISLLMGSDTFYQLPLWFEWQTLLSLANIIVVKRALIQPMPLTIEKLVYQHKVSAKELMNKTHGGIYIGQVGLYPLSSTTIRNQIKAQGINTLVDKIPRVVIDYISIHQLYC